MTIPKIAGYPLPGELDIPASRVSWELDPSRAALLIHDLQEYFLDFYDRGQSPIAPMLERLARLKKSCRDAGIPVVYSAQPPQQTPPERALLEDMWGPGLTAQPGRAKIEESVAPGPGDTILTKWRYSAFARTHLSDWLNERGRDQLIICGVYGHIGCQATAVDAFMSDVQPFLVADAMADFSRAHHDAALSHIAGCSGVVTVTSLVEKAVRRVPESQNVQSDSQETEREVLRREVAHLLDRESASLEETDNLVEEGLDSMRLMAMVERLNTAGFSVTFLELAETPTLLAWQTLLSRVIRKTA
jgi:bifunctional isochorismate lyase/aryl carrier protein